MKSLSLGNLAAWLHETPKPRGRVLLIHGIGEHSGRHLNTIAALNAAHYEVIRFDLRGAGESGGRRQYVKHFEDYVEDTAAVYNWICATLPPLPLFILGHSLGGCIAIHFTARYAANLKGLALTAPAFKTGDGISPLKIKVGRVVAKLVPELRIPKSTPSVALSRDPQVGKDYDADTLACQFNTLQQGSEVLRAMAEIPEKLSALQLPIFIAHGTADVIVALEGSFELIQKLPAISKVLHVLPGGFHEPHNDIDKQAFFTLLIQWLDLQLLEPSGEVKTVKRSAVRLRVSDRKSTSPDLK